jgi:hypothetical protein
MSIRSKSFSFAALDADGISASQTPADGGAQSLTITGALASGGVAAISPPRHVAITSAGDDSGRTFTVTGTNESGQAITETVTGADTGAAVTKNNFATVTAIAVDDDTAAAVTAGTSNQAHYLYPTSMSQPIFDADLTGTASCTVKATNFNVFDSDFDVTTTPFRTVASGKTSDFFGQVSIPCAALKFDFAGMTSAVTVAFAIRDQAVNEVA